MKKVITHNFKTLSIYSAIQSMLCHLFSLFTFEFNHVWSFPGSACYCAEVRDWSKSTRGERGGGGGGPEHFEMRWLENT